MSLLSQTQDKNELKSFNKSEIKENKNFYIEAESKGNLCL